MSTVVAVMGSLATVVAQAAVGAYAWRTGVLSPDRAQAVGKLVTEVLQPCLFIYVVSKEVSLTHLVGLWILPLAASVYFALSCIVGLVVSRIVGTSSLQGSTVVGAIIFHNSGALPMTLVQLIAEEARANAPLAANGEAGRAMLYVSLLGSCFLLNLFSGGSILLSKLSHNGPQRAQTLAEVLSSHRATQAIVLGLAVACFDPAKRLFHADDGGLRWVTTAIAGIGKWPHTLPCATHHTVLTSLQVTVLTQS